MTTTRVNDEARCPACQSQLANATGKPGDTPQPGDQSVCVYCASMLVFNSDLTLRLLRHEDLAALPAETARELAFIVACVQARATLRFRLLKGEKQ